MNFMVKSIVFQVNDMTSRGPKTFCVALQTPTNMLKSLHKTIVSLRSKQNDRKTSQTISEDQNASYWHVLWFQTHFQGELEQNVSNSW